MNNDALKYVIGQAISNIISKNRSDYASLSEIYEEVANLQNEENSEGLQAQVRGRLQECCSQYDAYLGKDDFFQTKEKHSGLWKNKITGEPILTPIIIEFIKRYPGIDMVTLKTELYRVIELTPGDMAISKKRPGEMKVDQIMRNFVSHKDSHKDIKFVNDNKVTKMYYIGEEEETQNYDISKTLDNQETIIDVVEKEIEIPKEEIEDGVKLTFIDDDLMPKKSTASNKIYIRKNDLDTWIKKETSRVKNGNLAENLVYTAEKLKLIEQNREDLADKVKWISRDSGDGYGYDILSYELLDNNNYKEIYIEVKSTKNINDNFIMSANELKFAIEHKDNYKLYRVAKVKSKSPVCKVIESNLDDVFKLEPNDYKLSIKDN